MTGFRNTYVLTLVDPTYNEEFVVGVFEANGLAEMARKEAEGRLSDRCQDRGVFFRITAYQTGKLYDFGYIEEGEAA